MNIGDRFGYLTVESLEFERTKYPSGRPKVKIPCVCNCGSKILVTRGDLYSGHTKSCGCFRVKSRFLGESISGLNSLYTSYKGSARSRNLTFNITKENFRTFTSQNCFYCGSPPISKSVIQTSNEDSKKKSLYIYNGLDRIDNNLGYETNNVVPCCKKCNISKHNYSQQDFIKWIAQTYNNLKEQNKL